MISSILSCRHIASDWVFVKKGGTLYTYKRYSTKQLILSYTACVGMAVSSQTVIIVSLSLCIFFISEIYRLHEISYEVSSNYWLVG